MKDFSNVVFHRGEFPFDFDQLEKISLLHIDADNYNPTKICLEQLWDKMVPGGIVIVDFHDSWATGAEKATKDFFEGKRDLIMFRTGKALIIK
jgi:predicted O-methyltransferase YrrM